MQTELLNTRKWSTTLQLAAAVAEYFDNVYNVERRHSYLGNLSLVDYEKLWHYTQPNPQLSQSWLTAGGHIKLLCECLLLVDPGLGELTGCQVVVGGMGSVTLVVDAPVPDEGQGFEERVESPGV